MKNIYNLFSIAVLVLASLGSFAQLINNNAHIHVPNGIYLNAQCDIQNNASGGALSVISNEGVIITSGNITNDGTFSSTPQSYVRLDGASQNILGANPPLIGRFVIEGSGNKNLNIGVIVSDSLIFNSNKILINNSNLTLLSNAKIGHTDNARFVVTNGNGSLVKKSVPSSIDFLFPVGTNINSYTPVEINNAILDSFSVRVIDGVNPTDQTTVQKTYIIKKDNPILSNPNISVYWNLPNEGSLFDRGTAMMFQQVAGLWNLLPNNPNGAAPVTPPLPEWKYTASNVSFLSNQADSFIVKNYAPPTIHTQPQDITICENENAFFQVTAASIGTMSFQWQINCSGSWTDITNGGNNPTYAGALDSILNLYSVPLSMNGCMFRCIISSIGGSIISDSATLTIHPAPLAYIIGDTAICEGDPAVLTAYLGDSYLWSTNETTQSITVYPVVSSVYTVTVSNSFMCTNSASINVFVTPSFQVYLTSNFAPDNEVYVGQTIIFTASPATYDNYEFFVDGVSVQSGTSNEYVTATLLNNQVVSVMATVNNCHEYNQDTLRIKVKKIANAFTPYDKDGINDVFGKGVDLVVFNRWGQVLYEGIEGWDGLYNGKQVSPGTYYYIMKVKLDEKETATYTGSLLLIAAINE